ncbi:mitochondrial ribosomal protein S22 [Dermatophagoides pteronyssinus]|uniref:28S ribosomal protein S22, mitochondrial-like n=1 Tax=Dermatophagoides pteronyssinus TaxID=6956 RepID=A0A6P6XV04_DERPT|nr:28S ribosomal protein S22, mitochondrial-like [Dermatophagoides pteronyssinus]
MFKFHKRNLLKLFSQSENLHRISNSRCFTTTRFLSNEMNEKNQSTTTTRNDMEDLFLDKRVGYLLKALTGYDPVKVFSTKSLDSLNSPKYRLMTDEQLKMEIKQADQRADSLLQMPPVKYPTEYEPRILEKDIALQGFLDPSIKLVFMDATAGFTDNERMIVVREPDGTLREANREERHRTNQIFYPIDERHIELPKMFDEPHLTEMMNRAAYKLLLDNICLHFEPEDPKYQDLCHKTYEHITSNNNFDHLLFTRHYGGMVFYLAFNRKIDSLLYHLITEQRINDGHNLLILYYIINPSDEVSKIVDEFNSITPQESLESVADINRIESSKPIEMEKFLNLLKIYLKNDSNSNLKSRLELSLQKLLSEQQRDEAKN